LVIVGIGVILLADNLGWFDARYVLRSLWPLALVAVGVTMVRSPDHRRSRSWGWVLITVGTWIFLDRIGWVHVSLWHLLLRLACCCSSAARSCGAPSAVRQSRSRSRAPRITLSSCARSR
jgi:hypothetical protein